MNKTDFLHAIDELSKLLIKIEKEYSNKKTNILNENILIKEEYIIEHAKYKIGDTIVYENEDGLCYNLIIHSINVSTDGEIIYDIGSIAKITHKDLLENKLKRIQ